jgi:bacterioferritin (cytochrome b1)
VIDILNNILSAGLGSINQSFVHAKLFEQWGCERL